MIAGLRFLLAASLAGVACLPAGALRAQDGDPLQVPEAEVETEAKLIEAYGLSSTGEPEAAIEIYEELLAADGANAAAAFSAAKLLLEDDPRRALKLMQQAHRGEPDNTYISEALAVNFEESGRFGQAARLYTELFEQHPKREDFLIASARAHAQNGEPQTGRRLLEEHVKDGGRYSPELGQELFTLAVSMNDPKAAVRALEELMQAFPRNPQYYQELAMFYRRTGDEDAARAVWERMAETFPEDGRAALGLAGQSKLTDEEEDFIGQLAEPFANRDLDIDAKVQQLFPIVQDVVSRGDTVLGNRVLPLAELLTEVHPEEPKAFAIHGDLLLGAGQPARAVEAYRQTLELDPAIYLVWDQLLTALYEANLTEALLDESENALLLFPNQARLYYYNGRALDLLGDYAPAENTLRQGIVLSLSDQVLLYDFHEALAQLYLHQERYAEALAEATEALSIRPKHGPALSLRGEILLRTGEDKAAALVAVAQGASESPQDPYVLTVEALSQLLSADVAMAETTINRAEAFGAANLGLAREVRGDVAFLQGRVEDALADWQEAANLGGGSSKLAEKLSTRLYVK